MSHALFKYPKQAQFNRVVPKNKFYEYGNPSSRLKDFFVRQIQQILWAYKLAPETINLPSKSMAPEIQVFVITLKTSDYSKDIIRLMDKSIMAPLFYELRFDGKIKSVAAFKRPSDTDSAKWVTEIYFESDWLPETTERHELPVVLDLGKLYQSMLRKLMPIAARPGEALVDQAHRIMCIENKKAEHKKLEAKLSKERQFNRKVEMNAKLRELQNELDHLSA